MDEFLVSTLGNVTVIVSVILNVVILLKPVVLFLVKKTETQTDDKIAETIYGLLDKLSPEAKKKLMDNMK